MFVAKMAWSIFSFPDVVRALWMFFYICVFHPRAAGHFVFYDDDDENADARCLWPSYECRPLISIDSGSRPCFVAPRNFATNNNNFQKNNNTFIE
jgi:hypothetical protein